jgi:hypothetical protein
MALRSWPGGTRPRWPRPGARSQRQACSDIRCKLRLWRGPALPQASQVTNSGWSTNKRAAGSALATGESRARPGRPHQPGAADILVGPLRHRRRSVPRTVSRTVSRIADRYEPRCRPFPSASLAPSSAAGPARSSERSAGGGDPGRSWDHAAREHRREAGGVACPCSATGSRRGGNDPAAGSRPGAVLGRGPAPGRGRVPPRRDTAVARPGDLAGSQVPIRGSSRYWPCSGASSPGAYSRTPCGPNERPTRSCSTPSLTAACTPLLLNDWRLEPRLYDLVRDRWG